jgi:hypothetical protein
MKILNLGFVALVAAPLLIMGCQKAGNTNRPGQVSAPSAAASEEEKAKYAAAMTEYENTLAELKAAYAAASDEKAVISARITMTEARIKALESRMKE